MADPEKRLSGKGPRNGHQAGQDSTSAERARILETVVNAAPAVIAYWDRDLVCLFGNTAFVEWFDSTKDGVIGRPMSDFLDMRGMAAIRPFLDGVLSGESQHFETALIRADGSQVNALTIQTPDVRNGEVIGFTTHSIDTHSRRETEATLRAEVAERQRANRIIRASATALEEAQRLGQIGSWTWTRAKDVVVWSKELYRIMGLDPAAGAPAFSDQVQIYTPESWARLREAVDHALNTGAAYQTRLRYVRPDGVTGWLDARGEATRDTDGAIIGLHGTVQVVAGRAGDRQRRNDQGPPPAAQGDE